MILAMSHDMRVLMVKLADRLHNMRTLDFQKAYKQRRIAQGDDGHLRAAGQPSRVSICSSAIWKT